MKNQKGFTSFELAVVIAFGFMGAGMGFALYALVYIMQNSGNN